MLRLPGNSIEGESHLEKTEKDSRRKTIEERQEKTGFLVDNVN